MKKTEEEIEALAKAYAELKQSQPLDIYARSFIAGYTACQEEDRWIPVIGQNGIEQAYYITSENGNVRVLAYDGTAFVNRDGVDENVQWFINKPLPNPPKK